jgi:hypothetical protein
MNEINFVLVIRTEVFLTLSTRMQGYNLQIGHDHCTQILAYSLFMNILWNDSTLYNVRSWNTVAYAHNIQSLK